MFRMDLFRMVLEFHLITCWDAGVWAQGLLHGAPTLFQPANLKVKTFCKFFFPPVYECFAFLYVCALSARSACRVRRGYWISWDWSYRQDWAAIGCWQSNLGPLKEQEVLQNAKTSFQHAHLGIRIKGMYYHAQQISNPFRQTFLYNSFSLRYNLHITTS